MSNEIKMRLQSYARELSFGVGKKGEIEFLLFGTEVFTANNDCSWRETKIIGALNLRASESGGQLMNRLWW